MSLSGPTAEAVPCQTGDCSAGLEQLWYLGGDPAASACGAGCCQAGGAALVGMLPTSHPLCLGLPTSARGNQKKRICTPQLAVVSTNRGTQRASSLLYVVLQFHSRFLPLLAASWLPSHTGISAAIGSARLG